MKLSDLAAPDELAAVRAPLHEARALPNRAYHHPSWFALEEDRIFARRWVAVTFGHRLARPGDAAPVDIAGRSVVVVRGDDGQLRAFHNVSAGDGCEVVLAPATGLTRLVSPYHGWEWDLRGRLTAIPYWDGAPDPSPALVPGGDLVSIACATWLDLVFVCLADPAPPFAHTIAPITERLAGCDCSDFAVTRGADGAPAISAEWIEANWKIAFENDVELLHEAFVHESYRRSPHSPKVDDGGKPTYVEVTDSGLFGFHVPTAQYFEPGELDLLPLLPVEGEPFLPSFHIYDLYPNVQLGFGANHFTLGILHPRGPERTWDEIAYYAHSSVAEAPDVAAALAAPWAEARAEDNVVCAATQRGRRAPGQAMYSPFWDGTVQAFHQLVLEDLGAGDA